MSHNENMADLKCEEFIKNLSDSPDRSANIIEYTMESSYDDAAIDTSANISKKMAKSTSKKKAMK